MLKKIEVGSTVHFRSGGKAVVTDFEFGKVNWQTDICRIWYLGSRHSHPYRFNTFFMNGNYASSEHPWDIVKVDPSPEFDLSTAKWGMSFKNSGGDLFFYVGINPTRTGEVVFISSKNKLCTWYPDHFKLLRRDPDYDIEI